MTGRCVAAIVLSVAAIGLVGCDGDNNWRFSARVLEADEETVCLKLLDDGPGYINNGSAANTNRHRLNPRGNRALNHAIHMIAVTQVAHDTPGRAYYLRKQAEGKTRKEALRALRRRVSDAVWRQLQLDH